MLYLPLYAAGSLFSSEHGGGAAWRRLLQLLSLMACLVASAGTRARAATRATRISARTGVAGRKFADIERQINGPLTFVD
jgi:hypothetical protein